MQDRTVVSLRHFRSSIRAHRHSLEPLENRVLMSAAHAALGPIVFDATGQILRQSAANVSAPGQSSNANAGHGHGSKKHPKITIDAAYAADHAFAEDEAGGIQYTGSPTPDTPSPSGTIEAANFDTNITTNGGFVFIPPDNSGTVGPTQVMNTVNCTVQWFNKDGSSPHTASLQSFFTSLTPKNALFDPKVVYDTYNSRFVVVALERVDTGVVANNDSRILLAVSQDSNPNDGFFFTAVNSNLTVSGHSCWLDYPGFAVDSTAVYVTGNMFAMQSDSTPGAFEGSRALIVSKTGFYTGGAPTSATFYDPATASGATGAFTLQPAMTYGTTPGSTGTFLVSSGFTGGAVDFLAVIRVDSPLSSPTFTNTFISLGDIANGTGVPSAPQKSSGINLDGGDIRVMNAVWRSNTLWAANDINPTATYDATNAGQETAHWYKINTTTLASLTLSDQGDIGGEDVAAGDSTFYPSVAVDSAGNLAIGFSVSGTNTFASAAYTVHATSDAASTVEASVVYAAGVDFYVRTFTQFSAGRNRWGDYSSLVIDPAGTTFWAYNQYASTRGTATSVGGTVEDGRWATRYASFAFPAATGSISGTMFLDNMSNGVFDGSDVGEPSQTVFLDVDNSGTLNAGDISTTTGAGGAFTFASVPAATYTLREVVPASTVQSSPAAGSYNVILAGGAALTGYTFGNFPLSFGTSSGNDAFTVQLDAGGTNVQILLNAVVGWQAPKTLPPSLTFATDGGDDTFTVNGANGNPVPVGGISDDGGTQTTADTLNVIGTAGADTLTVSSTAVVFGGRSINYTNTESLVIDPGAGSDSLTVNSGTPHLPAQTPGGGILTRTFSTLAINSPGVLTVNPTAAQVDRTSLVVTTLSFTGTGKLDLTDNEMTVTATPAVVCAWIAPVPNNIFSSSSGGAVGYNDIGSGKTRVRFTRLGDTNLDGTVNVTDLGNLASNYGLGSGASWVQGDTNYDGTVDVTDLGNLASNYGSSLT